MKAMTKMATANSLVKQEIAYFEPEGHIEIRSWWRHICTGVDSSTSVRHTCEEDGQEGELPLYAFPTIYGRQWLVGGCATCGRIYYYQESIPPDGQES